MNELACELVQTLRIIPEHGSGTSSKDHRHKELATHLIFGDSTVLSAQQRRCLLSRCCVKRRGCWRGSGVCCSASPAPLSAPPNLPLWAGDWVFPRAGLHRLQRSFSALSAAFWPIFLWLLSARFLRGLQKQQSPHRLYSRRCGVFTAGHPCAFRPGSDRWPAARRCWQRFCFCCRKTHSDCDYKTKPGGIVCPVMFSPILLHSGSKAPTQTLLGQIATAIGCWINLFTREDL